jgi:hypothetical protein
MRITSRSTSEKGNTLPEVTESKRTIKKNHFGELHELHSCYFIGVITLRG